MQPTVGIDRLGGLLPDLGDVLLAEVGASQVAHHDVAAAEAQLALVLLVDVGERTGALHLNLRVEVLLIDLEGPDLDARHLRAARAPLVHLVRGHGAGAGALRHAVDLVDGEAQRAEVLEGVDADGRRTREAELALVQPQPCLHFGQNRIGRRKAPRHSAAATELHVHRVLERHGFRLGAHRLLDRRARGADGADLIRDLLPDQGDAQEDRGLGDAQPILDRLLLQVVGPGEEDGVGGRLESGGRDRGDDVQQHACHVRQWQVRQATLFARGHGEAAGLPEVVEHGHGLEDEVVVRDHHRFRLAGGARGVDECGAVAWLRRIQAL
mmetsp:Transcript_96557/g.259639  ORF Transcript_96557/g.259639 Transcript_96557/m.259639 type:complete len:325 (-) Transcript_96557:688-1662(-)